MMNKKCGCGGELRYSHSVGGKIERMSCNKYGVCLTWEQQHNKILEMMKIMARYEKALQKIVDISAMDYEYKAWAKEGLKND